VDHVQSNRSHDASNVGRRIATYVSVVKPGIIAGNLLTATAGFFLAAPFKLDRVALLATLIGLSCIVGSASLFNNYWDRIADAKMGRTKDRALASGKMSQREAIWFASILALLGTLVLAAFTNLVALSMALLGMFVYVALYSPLKYKTHHATLIGSIAGSLPPLVGYCARSHQLDLAAMVLFLLVAFWQLSHFFAIAIRRLDDYRAASIPVLPVKRGVAATQVQMIFYIAAFIATVPLLTSLGRTSYLFPIGVGLAGGIWLGLSIRGVVRRAESKRWAKQMFFYSLGVILVFSLLLIVDSAS
jgi:heme o synthase